MTLGSFTEIQSSVFENFNKSEQSTKLASLAKSNHSAKSAQSASSNPAKPVNIETWRDLPFIGNKDIQTYHRNPQNVSRKNLPIYYPISSPLEDNYFN
jgi:hypothetical protein